MDMSQKLPPEVLALVFAHLAPRDLASTSLVCRFWQVAGFPSLYQTMYICDPKHLNVLETRLAVQGTPREFSIPYHLENLKFDCHRGELIALDDLECLYSILPELIRLRSVSWEMNFMPYTVPAYLYSDSIQSVHLASTSQDVADNHWYKELWQFLDFSGLTHFHFKTNDLSPGFNKRYIECFSLLVERSPSLESIVLNIFNDDYRVEDYSMHLLFQYLSKDFHAPKLHTLHLLGEVDLDWLGDTSGVNPVWGFLARHTQIESFAIGWEHYYLPGKPMNSDDLPRLLPSLRHFTGPSFFCEALIGSNLVAQLESLVVTHTDSLAREEGEVLFGALSQLFDQTNCPKLRKLGLWVEEHKLELEATVVEKLFRSAKALEEFEFRQGVGNYLHFLDSLSTGGAENLCRITLNRDRIFQCAVRDSMPDSISEWEVVLMDLVGRCPKLELIVGCGASGEEKWQVFRQGIGERSVVRIGHVPLK